MATKSFLTPSTLYEYQQRDYFFFPWQYGTWGLSSSGEMETFNHFPLDTNVDDGGPWSMTKRIDTCTPGQMGSSIWQGPFTVGAPRAGWGSELQTSPQPTDLAMQGKGATAISRCSPTNPSFSIPQAIGEAREGLPSILGRGLLKERARICREAGNEYINVEFGWKPLVSDLRSFAKAVNDSHEIWQAYRKGSGQKNTSWISLSKRD
jgi:hypothetical protein